MTIREAELDHAFAESLERSELFRKWLLMDGRFGRFANNARLLDGEQTSARKAAKHWWKHWWCTMPDGSQGETDLFLVFEAEGFRFALHIENKPLHGALTLKQAAAYRPRAILKANDPAWLAYVDFETILLAPASFVAEHMECVGQFDRVVTYEQVAPFAPKFAEALR